ncbi:MAG: RnfABCDGE type electron transport complex subunit D [Clostridia bacterium]|nr:RnfABCDGE type electron transport complex subunit D [Clostridia bacterium]
MTKKTKKLRRNESVFYADTLVLLLPLAVLAVYRYGLGALCRILSCMLVAVLCEIIGSLLMKCQRDVSDCSALFIGAATALMLPANIPYLIAFSGVSFAVLAVKLPLGGTQSAPFVPTAAGFAFMTLCWSDKVFGYPIIGGAIDSVNGLSLSHMLSLGTSIRPNYANIFDVLTGNYSGPSGAGCIIVLLAGSIYLCLRHRKSVFNILGFLLSCSIMALLFPRISSNYTHLISLLMELCSGVLIFSAVFFVTDPATSPSRPSHRFMYGIFTGIVCMVMRYFSSFEESTCFGVLIANAAWPAIQIRITKIKKKKQIAPRTSSAVKGDAQNG